MSAGEDRSCRLALELLERDQRVVPAAKPRGALLDERADERSVLVEGRAAGMFVLDERNGQLAAVVELAQEIRERTESEPAKGRIEVRSANCHG